MGFDRWRWRAVLASAVVVGCGQDLVLRQAAAPNPAIPFVGHESWEWPVWPLTAGWLTGGSGYRAGWGGPFDVTPGLGMPLVLFPSRRVGSWMVFPGVIEINPIDPHFAVWYEPPPQPPKPLKDDGGTATGAGASEAVTSPRPAPAPAEPPKPPVPPKPVPLVVGWTKMQATLLPRPVSLAWPDGPVYLSPWGPVDLSLWQAPDGRSLFPLGFPVAGGTPVPTVKGRLFRLAAVSQYRDVLFDLLTRTLHPIVGFPGQSSPRSSGYKDGLFILYSPNGDVSLVEQVSESVDPLPEIDGNSEYRLTYGAEFIFFTKVVAGRRTVQVFDRRTRLVDPLSRLNAGRDVFDCGPSRYGRLVAVTLQQAGHTDVAVYDTVTALLNPLPGVNTPANESKPDLDDSGRWLAYVTDAPGRSEVRIYDLATGAIDTLPDVNTLAPIRDVDLAGDGYLLWVGYAQAGHHRVALYLRPTGIIDPLPELNQPDTDSEL